LFGGAYVCFTAWAKASFPFAACGVETPDFGEGKGIGFVDMFFWFSR
jgi:hypothetical protein